MLIEFKTNLKETKTTSLNLCLIHSSSLSSYMFYSGVCEFQHNKDCYRVNYNFFLVSLIYYIAIKCNLINVKFASLLCDLILILRSCSQL